MALRHHLANATCEVLGNVQINPGGQCRRDAVVSQRTGRNPRRTISAGRTGIFARDESHSALLRPGIQGA
jgi:hypothetical protein